MSCLHLATIKDSNPKEQQKSTAENLMHFLEAETRREYIIVPPKNQDFQTNICRRFAVLKTKIYYFITQDVGRELLQALLSNHLTKENKMIKSWPEC